MGNKNNNLWKPLLTIIFISALIAILISLWGTGTFSGASPYHTLEVTVTPTRSGGLQPAGPIEVSIYDAETGDRIVRSNISTSTSGGTGLVPFSISNVDHAIAEINVLKPMWGFLKVSSSQVQIPINENLYRQYICLGTGSIFLTLNEAIDGCLGN